MSNIIHPTAIIGSNVSLGDENSIGPCVTIENGVKLGRRNRIFQGTFIGAGTELGDDNEIHMNAVIGTQDIATRMKIPRQRSGTKMSSANLSLFTGVPRPALQP